MTQNTDSPDRPEKTAQTHPITVGGRVFARKAVRFCGRLVQYWKIISWKERLRLLSKPALPCLALLAVSLLTLLFPETPFHPRAGLAVGSIAGASGAAALLLSHMDTCLPRLIDRVPAVFILVFLGSSIIHPEGAVALSVAIGLVSWGLGAVLMSVIVTVFFPGRGPSARP